MPTALPLMSESATRACEVVIGSLFQWFPQTNIIMDTGKTIYKLNRSANPDMTRPANENAKPE